MTRDALRQFARLVLPLPLRRVIQGCLQYARRVGRWPVILWLIRGTHWDDQWILVRSALAAPFTAFRQLLHWQDPILLADADVTVRGIGRFHLRARCDDLYHVFPWRERGIVNALRTRLRAGDTFIDAGANIGFYTVMAARLVGENGTVLAVEMMPDTAASLQSNIALNDLTNVTLVRAALSDGAADSVTATVRQGKFGQASIVGDRGAGEGATRIDVPATTLDAVLGREACARMMKMDLEGAELAALQGGEGLLKRVDFVIVESCGWVQDAMDPVARLLHQGGFAITRIDGNNKLATRGSGAWADG